MTRPCTGCGLHSCSGDCFLESDPDAVEFAENIRKLADQLTEVRSDPLKHLEPKRVA